MTTVFGEVLGRFTEWWKSLDRSDWPTIDAGPGVSGQSVAIPVCPGCGLYDGNDCDPRDHYTKADTGCQWMIETLQNKVAWALDNGDVEGARSDSR